jgi:hypothetical protein
MKRKNLLLIEKFSTILNSLFSNKKELGDNKMRYSYKTINNNWLVPDRGCQRFIDTFGNHLRWVTDLEAKYLMSILEIHENNEAPKMKSQPHFPCEELVWEDVESPEEPGLSNNGGSYYSLKRIIKRSGWGIDDGYFLVENHLYMSDFEDQGWNERSFNNEEDAMKYIRSFELQIAA